MTITRAQRYQEKHYAKQDNHPLTLQGNTDHGPYPHHARADLAGDRGKVTSSGTRHLPGPDPAGQRR